METPSVRHGYTTGAQGNRLHYLDYGGDGPTLICMHGVIGNAWNWSAVASGIRDRRRGCWPLTSAATDESQWSASDDYQTSDHVADLAALIDSLGEGQGGPDGLVVGCSGGHPVRSGELRPGGTDRGGGRGGFLLPERDRPVPPTHQPGRPRGGANRAGVRFPERPGRDDRTHRADLLPGGRGRPPGAQARPHLFRTLALPLR